MGRFMVSMVHEPHVQQHALSLPSAVPHAAMHSGPNLSFPRRTIARKHRASRDGGLHVGVDELVYRSILTAARGRVRDDRAHRLGLGCTGHTGQGAEVGHKLRGTRGAQG